MPAFCEGGEEWIRKSAPIAAVSDMLRNRWTTKVSPKEWHLSALNVPLAGALVGDNRSHPRPPVDRTTRGACENAAAGSSQFPVPMTVRLGVNLRTAPTSWRENPNNVGDLLNKLLADHPAIPAA